MATIEERIAALETKLKQEKAKKQQIEARKIQGQTLTGHPAQDFGWRCYPRQSRARGMASRQAACHAGCFADSCR